MGLIDLLNHLLNFTAPAFVVALLTTFVGSRCVFGKASMPAFPVLAGLGFGAALLVLLAGWWMLGRDGRMATYAVMVLVCATVPWVAARAWKA